MFGNARRAARFTRTLLGAFCLVWLAAVSACGSGGEASQEGASSGEPLRIGYSDWPGWVMWEIAREKGFFENNGVAVEMVWMDYVPSMDAFASGQLDGVSMTNGDALVLGAKSAKPSVGILVNDYSDGNDMIIGRPGIASVAELRGKKVGVEVGFVDHLLLLRALQANGMTEQDVELVNLPTNELPQALAAGSVDAIAAWQPNSGQALKAVPGSRALYSSANAPGLIYDLLFVSRESLTTREAEWEKVLRAWYQAVDFVNDPATRDEAIGILAARVGVPPEEYATLMGGTRLLSLEEAVKAMAGGPEMGLASVQGSSKVVDEFNVKYGVYSAPQSSPGYLDATLAARVAEQRGAALAAR